MRQKTLQLVVTFKTVNAAMAMEKYCIDNHIPGKIIPVPREISSGCGMAWSTSLERRKDIEMAVKKAGIKINGIYELEI